jgi:hypothetical protein
MATIFGQRYETHTDDTRVYVLWQNSEVLTLHSVVYIFTTGL